VVALARWNGDTLTGIDLHPVTLGHGKPPAERGRPMLASGALAQKIIDDLTRLSQPFGTTVTFDGKVGRVTLRTETRTAQGR
jgi:poly-gamma-glutamate synthesis protein (capsule biosynthesis protein)